ncbi:MAG: Ig-like domain-containing protein [Thermoplasmata archaeon]|nr:Ig-like domain-containing protein [Thermoplasmata archaeon]
MRTRGLDRRMPSLRCLLLAALLALPLAPAGFAASAPVAPPAGHELPAGPIAPSLPTAGGSPRHPSLGGGSGELLVEPLDAALAPASGVEMNVTAFVPPALPPDASFQLSLVVVLGAKEAVFGIFENTGSAPLPFLAVFSNRTDQYLSLAYWRNLSLAVGTGYGFELLRTTGTSWMLEVNGVPFGGSTTNATVDFGVSTMSWDRGVSFSETVSFASTSYVPPSVQVPVAFATLEAGGWYLPRPAVANESGSPGGPWGIEGRLQHPTLAPGEVVSGPRVAPVASGTALWTGGPVPVRVGVNLAPTNPLAFGTVSVTATVADENGTPLPSVPLTVSDSNGSAFFPAEVTTDQNGSALTAFDAPNVSAPGPDPVRASVALLGYVGVGVGSIASDPPVELSLVGQSVPGRLSPGASAGFSFLLVDPSGHPASGVAVLFSLSGPGAVTPNAGATGGTGEVGVSVSSYGPRGELVVTATVKAPGYWGHGVARVNVAPSPPTLADRLAPYLWVFVVLAVAGVIAVVYFVRTRPKGAMPVLRLPLPRRRTPLRPPAQP